jgi:hypothetical protein
MCMSEDRYDGLIITFRVDEVSGRVPLDVNLTFLRRAVNVPCSNPAPDTSYPYKCQNSTSN